LRARVEAYNAEHGVPAEFDEVVTYLGQCVMARGQEEINHEDEQDGD
jgi:hypothetical protein